MRFKIISGMAFACTLGFAITSCFSMNTRQPSSFNPTDAFSQSAYEQTLQRNFNGKKISQQQFAQELAGRTIWFKSAPNERHHTYVFPQKIGVAIDWAQAFLAEDHATRFQTWGVINDPDCCVPGVSCDQKNMKFNGRSVTSKDTFGWEFCPGDEDLLNSIQQNRSANYRDPACDDSVIQEADHLATQIRENRCELKFGTSTGVVGFRKFPNPKFNAKRWDQIGGYKTYSEKTIREGMNNSIQPPFRVGLACASCHAGFDPLKPPQDLSNPTWANIKGETGNQFINISKLMASGMHESTLEAQLFTHTRPGTVDTSAVPHDFINNPGTINAIINYPQRPLFKDTVLRWNLVDTCDTTDSKTCQKQSYLDESGRIRGYKYWKWQKSEMNVPHILKGGEDSVGYDLAIQRVYANNGMCSEKCWQNSLTNLREFDFTSRGYGEAVFDIGQCREQCAAFRANEDRTPDILSYLSAARPTDLQTALQASSGPELNQFLENRFGAGSVQRGKNIFAKNCASCHSSQDLKNPDEINFLATTKLENGEVIRSDWMGNDKSTSIAQVGTYSCRALHTNHKRGRVWDQFASETQKDLGTGYYRNISLLNVWAHAPFMHNNSVGPEVCGKNENFHEVVRTKNSCEAGFDSTVAGRLKIYEQSMDELLTPSSLRRKKITRLEAPVEFPLGVKDFKMTFGAGMHLNTIANFDIKSFIYDFTATFSLLEDQGEAAFTNYWQKKLSGNPQKAVELGQAVKLFIDSLKVPGTSPDLSLITKYYRTCETNDDVENSGHDFGTQLKDTDKKALKAFMATL